MGEVLAEHAGDFRGRLFALRRLSGAWPLVVAEEPNGDTRSRHEAIGALPAARSRVSAFRPPTAFQRFAAARPLDCATRPSGAGLALQRLASTHRGAKASSQSPNIDLCAWAPLSPLGCSTTTQRLSVGEPTKARTRNPRFRPACSASTSPQFRPRPMVVVWLNDAGLNRRQSDGHFFQFAVKPVAQEGSGEKRRPSEGKHPRTLPELGPPRRVRKLTRPWMSPPSWLDQLRAPSRWATSSIGYT
jgi:hypothetical protein